MSEKIVKGSDTPTILKKDKPLKSKIPIDVDFEDIILYNIIENKNFFNTVYPKYKDEYFTKFECSTIFGYLKNLYAEHGKPPKPKEIYIKISNDLSLNPQTKTGLISYFKGIFKNPSKYSDFSNSFLISETTEYVQKNQFIKGIIDLSKKAKNESIDTLELGYKIMGESLQISFLEDTIYHYSGNEELDAETLFLNRLKEYKTPSKVFPTNIKSLDHSLGGGWYESSLNIIASQTHGGKSAIMVNMANNQKNMGYNIYFVTLEMPDIMVARRFDANYTKIPSNDLSIIENKILLEKFAEKRAQFPNQGKIVIDDQPAHSFSVYTLKTQLEKLKVNNNFVPDVIYIDYLTLVKSTRLAPSVGSYTYYKSVAEELHGVAKELRTPIISAQQINRGGFNQETIDMSDISDSMGIAMTADTFIILQRTPALDELEIVKLIKEKDRFSGDLSNIELKIDYPTFTYYSLIDEHGNTRNNILPSNTMDVDDMF